MDNTNDNDYLLFCNEMKTQYNELEKQKKIVEEENVFLKKELMSIFGLMRVLDSTIDDLHNIPNFVVELVERIRGALSYVVDTHILKIEPEEDEEIQIIVDMVFEN